MLERMGLPKEEETVKNAVSKVLAGLWFDRKLSRSSTVPHSGGVRVVPAELVYGSASRPTRSQTAPPSVRNGSEGAQSSHSQLRNEGVDPSAVQMVELQATGESNKKEATWLGPLLDRLLGITDETVTPAAKKKVESRCETLVASVVNYMLLLFEVSVPFAALRNHEGLWSRVCWGAAQSRIIPPKSAAATSKWTAQRILACFATLNTVCSRLPTLLLPHVKTLIPYLKGGDDKVPMDDLLLQLVPIIAKVIPSFDAVDPSTLATVEADLKERYLGTRSPAVVKKVLRCACVLADKVRVLAMCKSPRSLRSSRCVSCAVPQVLPLCCEYGWPVLRQVAAWAAPPSWRSHGGDSASARVRSDLQIRQLGSGWWLQRDVYSAWLVSHSVRAGQVLHHDRSRSDTVNRRDGGCGRPVQVRGLCCAQNEACPHDLDRAG